MEKHIKNNNPQVSVNDKSKPIDNADLLILKSRRFGKPSTSLHLMPYMVAWNCLEKVNKDNLDNKSN